MFPGLIHVVILQQTTVMCSVQYELRRVWESFSQTTPSLAGQRLNDDNDDSDGEVCR